MNEEEFIENLNTRKKEDIYDLGFKRGIEKGKLEERERIEKIIDKFMKERTYIKSSDEGTNVSIIKFMPFELEQLQKEIKVSGDSLTEFWDNPEDDRWDKEYNPDLLPETLKNKEEKQDE